MISHRLRISLIAIISLFLTACVSDIWTGVSLVYDRHNVYIKINDFQLGAAVNQALYHDKKFKEKNCSIEVAVFNRDVLLAGSVPSMTLRQEAYARVKAIAGIRRLYNELEIDLTPDDMVEDSFITGRIRAQIIADSDINPHQFKVVTAGRIVYLMGDVIPKQADRVIQFARECPGVRRVVKLLRYYNLSDKPIKEKA